MIVRLGSQVVGKAALVRSLAVRLQDRLQLQNSCRPNPVVNSLRLQVLLHPIYFLLLSFHHAIKKSFGCFPLPPSPPNVSIVLLPFSCRCPAIPLLCRQDCQGARNGRIDLRRNLKAVVKADWRLCRAR